MAWPRIDLEKREITFPLREGENPADHFYVFARGWKAEEPRARFSHCSDQLSGLLLTMLHVLPSAAELENWVDWSPYFQAIEERAKAESKTEEQLKAELLNEMAEEADRIYNLFPQKIAEASLAIAAEMERWLFVKLGVSQPIKKTVALSSFPGAKFSLKVTKEKIEIKRIKDRGGSVASYNLILLSHHYRTVYPQWVEARKIFEESQRSPDPKRQGSWLQVVQAAYPELPDDLIKRFLPYDRLPEGLQKRLKAKKLLNERGESITSEIALEHAQRLCGATPYFYEIDTLWRKKKETENIEVW